MSTITTNKTVQFHYKGSLSDGTVFDESKDHPMSFTVGQNQIISGLEKEMIGLAVNDKKQIKVPCDEAYGPINDGLVGELPKKRLPEKINEGDMVTLTTEDGESIPATIIRISDETVTLDANHPLAGKDLIFDIEIVTIL